MSQELKGSGKGSQELGLTRNAGTEKKEKPVFCEDGWVMATSIYYAAKSDQVGGNGSKHKM